MDDNKLKILSESLAAFEDDVTEAPIRTMNGRRDITEEEFRNATITELQKYYQMLSGLKTAYGHQRAISLSFGEWVAEKANRYGMDRM